MGYGCNSLIRPWDWKHIYTSLECSLTSLRYSGGNYVRNLMLGEFCPVYRNVIDAIGRY